MKRFWLGVLCGFIVGTFVGVKAGVVLRASVNKAGNEMLAPKTHVVVAVSNLNVGTVLSAANLRLMEVGNGDLPRHPIVSTSEKSLFIGKRVVVFVKEFTPLSWDYLDQQEGAAKGNALR